jgi:hypothetical protein
MSKPKRSTIIPLLLAIYLIVMAYIGWPAFASGQTSALQYFGTIGATSLILVLLHFTLKKRENNKNQ